MNSAKDPASECTGTSVDGCGSMMQESRRALVPDLYGCRQLQSSALFHVRFLSGRAGEPDGADTYPCPAVIAGAMSVSCHPVASPDWLGTTFTGYPSRLFLEPDSAQPGPVAVIVARRGKENIR